jgi:HD-GYP domain-containing protein (c-di-GMP phosphodiesterase class II)
MELLYDGLVIPHDIYDADAKILLLRQGHTLNISQIEAIRRFNKGRDTIQVTLETHKILLKNKPASNPASNPANKPASNPAGKSAYQTKLEQETGYTEVKDEALNMFNEIMQTNAAPHDMVHAITQNLSDKVEKTKPDLILDIVNALAPVDEYLQRHCINVSLLNGLIGKWLGLPKETVDMLIQVGLVHDCGKLAIPPQILNAPRKLTGAEFEVIKMHPVYGYEMLSEFSETIRCGVRGHHEKFGSRGYPDGLLGNNIPLAAQITAVSDIYDAMVSQRAYKTPRSPFQIITWIYKLRGTELEESITDTFIANMPKEMVNKSVMLSNGKVGVIHALDPDDLVHPYIRDDKGTVFKSSDTLFCTQMHLEG